MVIELQQGTVVTQELNGLVAGSAYVIRVEAHHGETEADAVLVASGLVAFTTPGGAWEPEDAWEPLGEGHPLAVIAAVEFLGGALRLGPDGVHRDGDVVCLV